MQPKKQGRGGTGFWLPRTARGGPENVATETKSAPLPTLSLPEAAAAACSSGPPTDTHSSQAPAFKSSRRNTAETGSPADTLGWPMPLVRSRSSAGSKATRLHPTPAAALPEIRSPSAAGLRASSASGAMLMQPDDFNSPIGSLQLHRFGSLGSSPTLSAVTTPLSVPLRQRSGVFSSSSSSSSSTRAAAAAGGGYNGGGGGGGGAAGQATCPDHTLLMRSAEMQHASAPLIRLGSTGYELNKTADGNIISPFSGPCDPAMLGVSFGCDQMYASSCQHSIDTVSSSALLQLHDDLQADSATTAGVGLHNMGSLSAAAQPEAAAHLMHLSSTGTNSNSTSTSSMTPLCFGDMQQQQHQLTQQLKLAALGGPLVPDEVVVGNAGAGLSLFSSTLPAASPPARTHSLQGSGLFHSSPLATAPASAQQRGGVDVAPGSSDEVAAVAAAMAQQKLAQIEQLAALQQVLREEVITLLPLI